jgi:hypothetical protein
VGVSDFGGLQETFFLIVRIKAFAGSKMVSWVIWFIAMVSSSWFATSTGWFGLPFLWLAAGLQYFLRGVL